MKAYLPREHGAWGLLFQPFVASAVVAGQWTWLYVPALALALLGFILKEPLIIVVRQRYVWKRETEETSVAARWVLAIAAGIALCLAAIAASAPRVNLIQLAILVGAGGVLTGIAVWMTVRNRQRSMALQIASAAGLGSTALLAALVGTGSIPAWSLVMWALLTAHAIAAIPVVHVRLELKARKTETAAGTRRLAIMWQWIEIGAAVVLIAVALIAAASQWWLATPLVFSAVFNSVELQRLSRPDELNVPVKRVGLRLLAISLAHTGLVMAAVWAWLGRAFVV